MAQSRTLSEGGGGKSGGGGTRARGSAGDRKSTDKAAASSVGRSSASGPQSSLGKKVGARREGANQIRGEKAVPRTERTVPVAPPKGSRAQETPMPLAAVDQRTQILKG